MMRYSLFSARIPFDRYCKNIYSENGEDGVLSEILKRLGPMQDDQRWCVEFGAWDGKYFSNTFRLVENGWQAVYIECDAEKYADLLETVKEFPNITPVQAMVSMEKEDKNSLGNLLKAVAMPEDYGILSIDVDSNDLDIWEAYDGMPKIVVIEIDDRLLPGILQRYGDGLMLNSFTSTLQVATRKGYTLVCHTGGNMIFVRDDLVNRLGLAERYVLRPELLFIPPIWLRKMRQAMYRVIGQRVTDRILRTLLPLRFRRWMT